MYYVYVLKLSPKEKKNFYFGYTEDLKRRIRQHISGSVRSTKGRDTKLIYYEAFESKILAMRRERGLKNSGSVYNALLRRLGLK